MLDFSPPRCNPYFPPEIRVRKLARRYKLRPCHLRTSYDSQGRVRKKIVRGITLFQASKRFSKILVTSYLKILSWLPFFQDDFFFFFMINVIVLISVPFSSFGSISQYLNFERVENIFKCPIIHTRKLNMKETKF